MSSLLNLDDPQSLGLLSLGLRLMSTPGKFGQAFGKSGMGAIEDITAAQGRKQQDELRKLQMQQMQQALAQQQRQAQGEQATQSYAAQALSPAAPIDANAVSGVAGPRPEALQAVGKTPGFDLGAALKAGVPIAAALQLQQSMAKDDAPIKLGAGEQLLDKRTFKPLAANPKSDSQSSLGQLIAEMNTLPQNDPRRSLYMQAIQKATTHQPPVNVSYGSPQAGINEKGESVFFQPSKDGKTPPSLIQGFKPAPQNRDTKLPAEIQRMNIAADTMDKLLGQYETLLRTHNPRDPLVQANPAARANFQSLMKNIQLQFKEVQALGALSGPDLALMEAAVTDPFTFRGAIYGQEGLNAQIKQARNLIKLRKEATATSQGKPEAAGAVDNDPLGLRK